MAIEWVNKGGPISEPEINHFELEHHFRFSKEHRRFLMAFTNGASVSGDAPIPTEDCPGGAGGLDGVYGINHQANYLNFAKVIAIFGSGLPYLIPFGYDQGNGQLFVDMVDLPGRLVYVPYEELGNVPLKPYHVANSISEYFEEAAKLADEYSNEDS